MPAFVPNKWKTGGRAFSGLRARLLVIVLLALIPGFGLMAHRIHQTHAQAYAQAQQRALDLAREIAAEQRRLVLQAQVLLSSLSHADELVDRDAASRCPQLLTSLLRASAHYTNLAAARLDGEVFCSALPLTRPVNVADRAYFRRALKTGDFVAGDYQIDRISGKSTVVFAYPVNGTDARPEAVVFAAIDLGWVSQRLSQSKLPASSVVTVVDRQGQVLARAPDLGAWVGRSLAEHDLFRAAVAHGAEGTLGAIGPNGTPRVYAFAPLYSFPAAGAFVWAGIPKAAVYAPVEGEFARDLLLLWTVTLLTLAALWIASSRLILRKVSALAKAAGRLRRGDLSTRTGLSATPDELGDLARIFDAMAAALQAREREIAQGAQALAETHRTLQEREEYQRLLLESMGEGLCAIDLDGLCTLINPAGVRLLGYRDASELLGKRLHDLIHHTRADGSQCPIEECLIARAMRENRGMHSEDQIFWRADGSSFAVECSSHPILHGGRAVGAVVSFSDISERKRSQARIVHLATHDFLTELPNRTLFNDRTSQALASARRTGRGLAVLFLDLDRFKFINDSLGHPLGDAVLKNVGGRLKALIRDGDTVARLGGDEFAILLVDFRRAEDVMSVARKILGTFSEPLTVDGHELFITVSIGASFYPNDGEDADTLLKHADVALFRVKEQGRNGFEFYTQDMGVRAQQRLELETALRRGLQHREFELHYQPQVDLRSETVRGVEALIRWRRPEAQWVSPEHFIPMAEESGLILPLGEWVLRTACAQHRGWQDAGLQPVRLAVNVSGRQFWQGDICSMVEHVLEETGVSADQLELEVTESVIMHDVPEIARALSLLKSSGVSIAIDDFGTGYSSLSYLRHLPVDKLKIDQTFVRDITRSPDGAGLIREIIRLAHALHLTVNAEGVENEAELSFLSAHGCDEVQGYYLSHPLAADGIPSLLQAGGSYKAI